MTSIRLQILKALRPISEWIAKVHAPWSRKQISGQHFYQALSYLEPGSILVSYTRGELASLFIPGKWKHAAIYCSKYMGNDKQYDYVIEAKTSGVTTTDLLSFMVGKDAVAIIEPIFCDNTKMMEAAAIAHRFIGLPYDFFFDPGEEAFYCSELIAKSYEMAIGKPIFEKRERLGVNTILPDDYAQAVKKWRIVWDSTEPKAGVNISRQNS